MRERLPQPRGWTTSAFQDHCGGNSKKHLPRKKSNKSKKRGGRPRVSDRAVANAIWYVLLDGMPVEGHSSGVVWGLLQRRPRAFPEVAEGLFEKLLKWMVEHYAKESGGSLGGGKRWIPAPPRSTGRRENGQEPHR